MWFCMVKLRSCRRDRRSVSPVVAMALLILIAIGFATALSTLSIGVLDDSETADLSLAIDAEFDLDRDKEPHWEFAVRHISGSPMDEGDVRVRLVDDRGAVAENVYDVERFSVGDTLYVGLWGSPSRATNCEMYPNDPDGNDNQIAGHTISTHSAYVVVSVIHTPSETTLDSQKIDLDKYPNRPSGDGRAYLVDGSEPSVNCDRLDRDEW